MWIRMVHSSKTNVTARTIKEELGIKGSKIFRKNAININWGNRGDVSKEYNDYKIINNPKNIRPYVNKYLFLKLLNTSLEKFEKVKSPMVIQNNSLAKELLQNHLEQGKVFLARHYYHKGGEDIIFVNSMDDIPETPNYFVEFIPDIVKEYRLHLFNFPSGTEFIRVSEKAEKDDYEGERNYQIKNLGNGWKFVRISSFDMGFCELCQALQEISSEILPIDFVAFDIGKSSNGIYYIFEGNTGPGLDSYGAKVYADALRRIIKEKYKEKL